MRARLVLGRRRPAGMFESLLANLLTTRAAQFIKHIPQEQLRVGVWRGEIVLDDLELQFDQLAGVFRAPPQMKANGGVFIIDDFGRQRVRPRDLLNRWMVPLEKHVDFLTAHGVEMSGLERVPDGRTFRWAGEYSADMNQRETKTTKQNKKKADRHKRCQPGLKR